VSREYATATVGTRGLVVEKAVSTGQAASVQAIITGSFSPLGKDAEVTLQLISTTQNGAVLGSAIFVIPADELNKRDLSLLPPKNNAIITRAEFDAKQKALEPYRGRNNTFAFAVTPDDLDGIYHEGEYMTMRIFSERDCYLKIIHVDVDGITQAIYPKVAAESLIRAGETRRIPDNNTHFRMTAPYGEEYILVAAYAKPFTVTSGGGDKVSEAVINRGLEVETGNASQTASPIATAMFRYTILQNK
jgi:hypothetical protein